MLGLGLLHRFFTITRGDDVVPGGGEGFVTILRVVGLSSTTRILLMVGAFLSVMLVRLHGRDRLG